ncbi:MAG: sensor histidine kinase [Vicinamibacterales bacterium]
MHVFVLDDSPVAPARLRALLPEWADVTPLSRLEDLRGAVLAGACLVVTEHILPWADWFRVLHETRALDPALPVVVWTDQGSERVAVRAMRAGAAHYLRKSVPDEVVHAALLPLLQPAQAGPTPDGDGHHGPVAASRAFYHGAVTRFLSDRVQDRRQLTVQAAAMDQLPAGAIALDADLRVTYWNRRAEELYGYPAAAALGRTVLDLVVPEESRGTIVAMERHLDTADTAAFESPGMRADGTRVHLHKSVTVVRNAEARRIGTIVVVESFEEIRERERLLREALAERGALIREVHHRVKNSLQVVSSLLSVQARQAATPGVRASVDQCQARIRAIATAHEALYEGSAPERVGLRHYLQQLVARLWPPDDEGAAVWVGHVAPATLDVDLSVSLALIVVDVVLAALERPAVPSELQVPPVAPLEAPSAASADAPSDAPPPAAPTRRVHVEVDIVEAHGARRDEARDYELVVRTTSGGTLRLSGLAEVLVDQIRGRAVYQSAPGGVVRVRFPGTTPSAPPAPPAPHEAARNGALAQDAAPHDRPRHDTGGDR